MKPRPAARAMELDLVIVRNDCNRVLPRCALRALEFEFVVIQHDCSKVIPRSAVRAMKQNGCIKRWKEPAGVANAAICRAHKLAASRAHKLAASRVHKLATPRAHKLAVWRLHKFAQTLTDRLHVPILPAVIMQLNLSLSSPCSQVVLIVT